MTLVQAAFIGMGLIVAYGLGGLVLALVSASARDRHRHKGHGAK